MEITINVNGTAPKPRVINVRQYSSGVDKVNFILNTCPISGEISAAIVGNELSQTIITQNNGNIISALWEIAPVFTAKSGCFDIQLRLEGSGKIWLSDKMLLIVSESTSGETQVSKSDELITIPKLSIDAIVNQDIIFKYEEE